VGGRVGAGEEARRRWWAVTSWQACERVRGRAWGRWRAGVRTVVTEAGGQAALAWMRVRDA
jgi:hypothetical protein